MTIFKNIEFWNWLYSSGNKPLPENLFKLLKTEFVYKNKEITSELEGVKHHRNFETVLVNIPITNVYSICSLLQLNKNAEFEENLYLKYKNQYYGLGWIDYHNH